MASSSVCIRLLVDMEKLFGARCACAGCSRSDHPANVAAVLMQFRVDVRNGTQTNHHSGMMLGCGMMESH